MTKVEKTTHTSTRTISVDFGGIVKGLLVLYVVFMPIVVLSVPWHISDDHLANLMLAWLFAVVVLAL
jgi:NADH:ubiquinone oxidoreductase subunit 3 (subunit A)